MSTIQAQGVHLYFDTGDGRLITFFVWNSGNIDRGFMADAIAELTGRKALSLAPTEV